VLEVAPSILASEPWLRSTSTPCAAGFPLSAWRHGDCDEVYPGGAAGGNASAVLGEAAFRARLIETAAPLGPEQLAQLFS
jgi:hypothetical protein